MTSSLLHSAVSYILQRSWN